MKISLASPFQRVPSASNAASGAFAAEETPLTSRLSERRIYSTQLSNGAQMTKGNIGCLTRGLEHLYMCLQLGIFDQFSRVFTHVIFIIILLFYSMLMGKNPTRLLSVN